MLLWDITEFRGVSLYKNIKHKTIINFLKNKYIDKHYFQNLLVFCLFTIFKYAILAVLWQMFQLLFVIFKRCQLKQDYSPPVIQMLFWLEHFFILDIFITRFIQWFYQSSIIKQNMALNKEFFPWIHISFCTWNCSNCVNKCSVSHGINMNSFFYTDFTLCLLKLVQDPSSSWCAILCWLLFAYFVYVSPR